MKIDHPSRCPPTRATFLTAALCWFAAGAIHAQIAPAPEPRGRAAYENYDIREDAAAAPARSAAATTRAGGQIVRRTAAGRSALLTRLPSLRVEDNRFGTAPEIVGNAGGTGFLTRASATPRGEILRGFLTENAALYGLEAAEVAGLVTFADYANPAGDMAWVGLRQEANGLPVFQGEIMAGFTTAGELGRTAGNLAVGLDAASLATAPRLTPAQAVAAASSHIGREVRAERLTQTTSEDAGRTAFLVGGPYNRASRTELMYFPKAPGTAVLAYAVLLWNQPRAYSLLVDANDGTLLWRKCITDDQTQTVTYNVYTGASPSPYNPTAALPGQQYQAPGVGRTDVTLVADDLLASPLGWITDGATVGTQVTPTGTN